MIAGRYLEGEDGGGRCGMDEERCGLWRSEEVSFVRFASDEGQEAEDDGREWEAKVGEKEERFRRQQRQMRAVERKGGTREGLVEASIGEGLERQLLKWKGKWVVCDAIGIIYEHVVTNFIGQEGIDAGCEVMDQIQGWFRMGEMWSWRKYVQWIQGVWDRRIGQGQ
jgi:hypothetical protein